MLINQLGHAETRSISIAAPPTTVLDLLSDPLKLPDWAPDFASAVKPHGEDWLVESGGRELEVRLQVSRDHGTVDLLRPGDPSRGARMRVLNNETGSEFRPRVHTESRHSRTAAGTASSTSGARSSSTSMAVLAITSAISRAGTGQECSPFAKDM